MGHHYTPEHINFLTENVTGRSRKEIMKMFNNHFVLELGLNQITAAIKNHRLHSGVDSRFKPGSVPFNKGKKGIGGHEPTQFKSGHKPYNYKPVGTERINGEGYTDVKIADPNKWKTKHSIIWEQENGPVPKGHVLIFGDGNRSNVELDNLLLVPRKQLSVMNGKHLIKNNVELTRTGIIVADLYSKISERKKAK